MGEGGCGDQAGPGKKQVDNLSPPTFCLRFTIYCRQLCGRREGRSNGQQVLKPQPARSPGGRGWDVNHHGCKIGVCSGFGASGVSGFLTKVVPAARLTGLRPKGQSQD